MDYLSFDNFDSSLAYLKKAEGKLNETKITVPKLKLMAITLNNLG